jgi:hypothetical protein
MRMAYMNFYIWNYSLKYCLFLLLFLLPRRLRLSCLFPFRIILKFKSYRESVGLLGRGISPTQGWYLHGTTQTEQKQTDIRASRGIRTHDPSIWDGEDISYLKPRGHCLELFVYLRFRYNIGKYMSTKNTPRGKQNRHVGFKVLTAVTEMFLAALHWRFGVTYCVHFQG